MKAIPKIKCGVCKNIFQQWDGNQRKSHYRKKFCSRTCALNSLRKGIDYFKKCKNCGKQIPIRKTLHKRSWAGVYHPSVTFCTKRCGLIFRNKSTKQKEAVSKKLTGRPSPLKGIKISAETRKKMSEAQKGEKHWNWKGGISPLNNAARSCIELKEWRRHVFSRDKYTCVICGYRGKGLEADHIKSWAKYPALRFSVSNGRTLCKLCHSRTPNYRGRNNKKNLSTPTH